MNIHGHERYFFKKMNQDCLQYQYTIQGYKKRKLGDLSIEDKLDLVDDIFNKKDYHENICARYCIKRESIKTLIKNLKKH